MMVVVMPAAAISIVGVVGVTVPPVTMSMSSHGQNIYLDISKLKIYRDIIG